MPYELADYVETETPFKVVIRVGGEIDLLKHFLAASLPVIVEKGFEGPDFDGWMGHYVLVTGYDDLEQTFTLQDSYYGPDQAMGYADLERFWRTFNFTYLVVYPPEREAVIMALLGPQADKTFNDQYTAQKASEEIYSLTGRDQYFAWFNRGKYRRAYTELFAPPSSPLVAAFGYVDGARFWAGLSTFFQNGDYGRAFDSGVWSWIDLVPKHEIWLQTVAPSIEIRGHFGPINETSLGLELSEIKAKILCWSELGLGT